MNRPGEQLRARLGWPAQRVAIVAVTALSGVAIALCVWLGVPLQPDRLVLLFLPVVLVHRRAVSFLLDWLPFLAVLFGYEFLRGVVGLTVSRANFTTMLSFDQSVFGAVPTEWLQQRFFRPDQLSWWDYAATVVYLFHFVTPIAFGLGLWLRRREWFVRFAAAFLLLSFLALATYLLFPAAPPWLAAQHGLLQTQQVLSFTFARFPARVHLPTIYSLFDPDLVAAVPSLHAGYALLIALFAIRFWGKRAVPVLLYPIVMSLSLVYLGEHYVGDVLAGGAFATTAFGLSEIGFGIGHRHGPRRLVQAIS